MLKYIDVPWHRQWDFFSCGAISTRIVVNHFCGGNALSYSDAVELTGAEPDGCNRDDVRRALRDCGIKTRLQKRVSSAKIRDQLDQDRLLITTRMTNRAGWHWIVINGYVGRDKFFMMDPKFGVPLLWSAKDLTGREAIVAWA
jgi:hypothetical protein